MEVESRSDFDGWKGMQELSQGLVWFWVDARGTSGKACRVFSHP